MNDFGKQQYNDIPIPEELDQVLWKAMARVEREKRRRRVKKWLTSAAAVFLVCFTCANVGPVYAYAEDLPVIGSLVQVLHIGSGGERTDGAQTDSLQMGETVELTFETADRPLDDAPIYNVDHLYGPDRIVVTLHGVRGMDFPAIREHLMATQAVRDAYRTMILDDSAAGFVVELADGWTYDVTEYAAPASLSIHFTENGEATGQEAVYTLCTAEMPYGEGLALTQEHFAAEGATQLKTASGQFVVTIGQYGTAAQAQEALRQLADKYGGADLEIVRSAVRA